jgi:uncharacterized FAD-dependent dehydrogenase
LAYTSSLKEPQSVLVVDLGKPIEERSQQNADECVTGAGGAGLFSDGKFSFYPAGTKIWEQNETQLKIAYTMLEHDLAPFKDIPSFPTIDNTNKLKEDLGNWNLKPYGSIYLSFGERISLIQGLVKRCLNIRYQTEFLQYSRVDEGYQIEIKDLKSRITEKILAKKIVFAGGRFMPRFLDCPKQFRRYEFGFRVDCPSHIAKKKENLVDPKYILNFKDQEIECRTFCWCENGEVIATRFKDIQTYSGRADCSPTARNNFGFNFRFKNSSLISETVFKQVMQTKFYKEKIKELPKILENFPEPLRKTIACGLNQLVERFPELNSDEVYIRGPTIEGIGDYPAMDSDFQVKEHRNIYVIGDCSGDYRGIVASMLSGYILALRHNLKQ